MYIYIYVYLAIIAHEGPAHRLASLLRAKTRCEAMRAT